MRENPQVSLLLNGYEGPAAEATLLEQKQAVSVTLYGHATLLEKPSKERSAYQLALQSAHSRYASAFQGPEKVVIAMRVDEALVVDVRNKAVRVRDPFGEAPVFL